MPSLASAGAPADHVLAVVDVHGGSRPTDRYLVPFVTDGRGPVEVMPSGLREASPRGLREASPRGLREASPGDGTWQALARGMAEARTIPALSRGPSGGAAEHVDAALVCRPAPGLSSLVPEGPRAVVGLTERGLGADQSNTSAVLGERLLLKAFRRLLPGLNPDLEMQAFLSEEVRFPGVPRLAGWAELVTRERDVTTIALLQEYVADGEDAYEAIAERLTAWILAPGEVSLEWATEVASDMGALTAALHVALADPPLDADDFAPREATRDELREWRRDAHRQLEAAVSAIGRIDPEVAAELRDLAPAIAARFTRFEATPVPPLVMRIHADLHLGQVLAAPDGYRIVDFEGEPTRPVVDRRRPTSPLRDVASMLRSLDHVGRSAGRRAARRRPESVADRAHVGLDIDAWLVRVRDRFLEAYRSGVREAPLDLHVDDDLLEAFEFAKEAYEFVYAATFLPDWLWAPREGMLGLVERFGRDG